MRPLRVPLVGSLQGRGLLFPLVLIPAVAAVLVQGAWEQNALEQDALAQEAPPRPAATVAEPVPNPPVRPFVRALDKSPLTYFADYWAQLAERAGPWLTVVGPGRTPGLVVGPRLVLTTVRPALELLAARDRAGLVGAGGARQAAPPEPEGLRLRGWDEEIGLAVFDVLGDDRAPFTLTDPHVLPSGSHVGIVTLSRAGEPVVAPGYLVGATSRADELANGGDLAISADLPETLAIAAVVDLDGALLGLVYRAPTGGRRAVSSTGLLRLIERLQAETVCRGIEVTDLDDAVREALVLEEGVLIEYVHREAFAPEPSLRGGDILVEWAGERVQSAAQFELLYDGQTPGALVRYRVLRNRRRISGGTIVPDADCQPVGPRGVRLAARGLALEWVPRAADEPAGGPGWRVATVAQGGPAAAAGVAEGDWLVAIGGTGVGSADDRDAIAAAAERTEPLLLQLLRGDRARLVAVAPPANPRPAAAAAGSGPG